MKNLLALLFVVVTQAACAGYYMNPIVAGVDRNFQEFQK